MTVLAMTLPLARTSPLHQPRRDVTVDAADDLTLNLSIVADDTPGAAPVSLAAVGTTLRLLLWYEPIRWDYGLTYWYGLDSLYSGLATIAPGTGGTASVVLPRGSADRWPLRLGYTLRLDLGGTARSTLAWGALHMPKVFA